MEKSCIVIFSGGQDSTTCLGWAQNRYKEVIALSFNYGQRHKVELKQAKKITKKLGIKHIIKDLDLDSNSGLIGNNEIDINSEHPNDKDLPISFVPGRNLLFLNYACILGYSKNIFDIVLGVSGVDYSGYPDCRPEFIDSFKNTAFRAFGKEFNIQTPLINLNKAETFRMAFKEGILDTVINESHTCYNGDHKTKNDWGFGCGKCNACLLRSKGWKEYKEYKENKNG